MAYTQKLIEIDNRVLGGVILGVMGAALFTTTFGKKVRSKTQGSVEKKLGL